MSDKRTPRVTDEADRWFLIMVGPFIVALFAIPVVAIAYNVWTWLR